MTTFEMIVVGRQPVTTNPTRIGKLIDWVPEE